MKRSLQEIPPRDGISRRALLLACLFSGAVWILCLAALSRAFVRDVVP